MSEPVASAAASVKSTAGRSLAEFLAEHNIRWGELIAGLLIVVCSIGLVVSLWSTITGMHRVIPSLIFLSGNTAIFGAGLYTLFRWRLQDTSRATLVIATLLVPLGILAGLSTGGIGEATAVFLNDPITLLAILGAGAIYVTLLWHASRALVGSSNALPMTLGVAGPAAVLPLVPAAIRSWGSSAGFLTYAGSAAVIAAIAWMVGRRRHARGQALGRRALVIGVTSFSLAVLATYLAFMLRETETGWLAIASSTLPGVILLAATAASFSPNAKRPKLALAGSVCGTFGLLAAVALLVPMMTSLGWFWTWAISFSLAVAVAAIVFRIPLYSAVTTLPIGIACVMTSPAIATDVIWTELSFWRKLIGGEPMLSSMVVGLIGLVVALLIRDKKHRKALGIASGCWLAFGTSNALLLTVAPAELMGIVPPWVLSAMLGVAAITIIAAIRQVDLDVGANILASVGTIVTLAFWVSVIKPFVIGESFPGLTPSVQTLLATGLCGMIASELLAKRKLTATAYRLLASGVFFGGSFLAILHLLVPTEELATQHRNAEIAIASLSLSVLAWLWNGLTDRDHAQLTMSRLGLIVTAIVVGYRFFQGPLMTVDSWRNGLAFWSWSALAWSIVGVIVIRDLALQFLAANPNRAWTRALASRVSWYKPTNEALDIGSRHAIVFLAMSFVLTASLFSFGSLVLNVGAGTELELYASVLFPLIVLVASGVGLFWPAIQARISQDDRKPIRWPIWERVYLASVFVWSGWQIAIRILETPANQLVLSTSLAAAGCFVMDLLRRESLAVGTDSKKGRHPTDGLLTAIGLGIVGVSSGALLVGGWLPSIADGLRPDTLITLSVAAWWTAGSITSGWLGYRHRSSTLALVSAAFVPAIVILVMPLWVPGDWWIWIQTAAVASGVFAVAIWLVETRLLKGSDASVLQHAVDFSLVVCSSVGIISSLALIAGVVQQDASLLKLHNLAGIILSLSAAALMTNWSRLAGPWLRAGNGIAWPFVLSLTSGHMAILLANLDGIAISSDRVLPMIWTATAFLAIAESCRVMLHKPTDARVGRWHAGVLVLSATTLCLLSGSNAQHFTVGLLACVAEGILATSRAVSDQWSKDRNLSTALESPKFSTVISRLTCWYTLVMGLVFVTRIIDVTSGSGSQFATAILGWVGSWAMIWRVACPDCELGDTKTDGASQRSSRAMLADAEAMFFVLFALAFETLAVVLAPLSLLAPEADGLLWVRLGMAVIASATICFRHSRVLMTEVSIAIVLVSSSLLGVRIAIDQSASPAMVMTIISLVISTVYAIMVFTSGSSCRVMNLVGSRWRGLLPATTTPPTLTVRDLNLSFYRASALPTIVVLTLNVWLLWAHNLESVVPMAICSVALLAVAMAELSERTGRELLRQHAVFLGLVAISMWASFSVVDAPFPLLSLSTRWFVAWVFLAAALGFAAPKMLGDRILLRWRPALRNGMIMAISLAVLSLSATLVQEGLVRVAGQTDQLIKPLYLGMAATLAAMSVLCTLGGILSGPKFSYRELWNLTDRQRVGLIVAAQTLGGLTWFHLFLCKSPLASLGLRAYWPYVVMALSFASVGITEWARRRGDEVLTRTLKQTALFLPLIPVIGFWLSGSWVTTLFGESDTNGWTYIQGRVTYQALLICAALYYGVISFLWKSGRARLVSIVVGNLALWVILVQTPDWGFLAHPQAWLIPPAVCVLLATHLHRKDLGTTAASSIRYATTLVIYITSTADMLIQGIGSTIWGPIVLIVLALIGAGMGVALRVRPFLYLGTTFVFIGVTSMVWHAQRQIDAVWPWWAFGITTGVLLLVGLMAIEKNKPKLRRIATTMQQWDA